VEIQGTAEGHAFRRHELDALLNLAAAGVGQLFAVQAQTLFAASQATPGQ
jgi:ribonuclease PH